MNNPSPIKVELESYANKESLKQIVESAKRIINDHSNDLTNPLTRLGIFEDITRIFATNGIECSQMKAKFIYHYLTDNSGKFGDIGGLIADKNVSIFKLSVLSLGKGTDTQFGDLFGVISYDDLLNEREEYIATISKGLGTDEKFGNLIGSDLSEMARFSAKPWIYSICLSGRSTILAPYSQVSSHPLWEKLVKCYSSDMDSFIILFMGSVSPSSLFTIPSEGEMIENWCDKLEKASSIEMANERVPVVTGILTSIMNECFNPKHLAELSESSYVYRSAKQFENQPRDEVLVNVAFKFKENISLVGGDLTKEIFEAWSGI